jgi:SAM-dependent methyltransferase
MSTSSSSVSSSSGLPLGSDGYPAAGGVARRPAGAEESVRANRRWWDAAAPAYLAEHGVDLGDADFLWCPEGLREADAHLLGDVAGALPLADAAVDLVCSAFGGLPFVADVEGALAEVARVLRPGGRFVASVNHPLRWPFPDSPDPADLRVVSSYFDRTPYVETDEDGRTVYVEHHRTVGDWVRAVVGAGLVLDDLLEPEWTPGRTQEWGQWSPERGALVPGTLILVCSKPT